MLLKASSFSEFLSFNIEFFCNVVSLYFRGGVYAVVSVRCLLYRFRIANPYGR